ncbi:MAG: HAD family hydrolase [Rhodobiaceae bacterium]|nr:HAD family hydrolase [Rhodobiaceae bacterium]MCC0016792.1 HAD family hydrolase [Rhodobiaceae bacterium]MCC0042601.1 HAD family hydrolase [Rhodobiaceae bacterium]
MTGPGETRPCAFLDRDGVLNVDSGYPHVPADLVFMPGAPEAVARLNAAGYLVVVVSNQSGVARGLFGIEAVEAFHAHIQRCLQAQGAHVDAFYYCPYHSDASVAEYRHPDHPDRKPNPGMILRAMRELPVRRAGSFLVGDKVSDMQAAETAGIPGHLYAGGRLDAFIGGIVNETAGERQAT